MLLAALFPTAAAALFQADELRWITSNRRMIACDGEVPLRAYIFEGALTTTL
jgi:hypothetical protein